jgi:hypothetical protein
VDYPERGVPSLLELGVVAALRPLHWSESLCCGGARREEIESEMTWPSSAALQTAAFSPSYLCVESPLRGILSLTTHRQSDSMVEIRQETTDTPSPPGEDEAKYRLIYTKSKVYVNPTAYARDNIPGFVAIVKRVRIPFVPSCHSSRLTCTQEAFTSTYLLAWIPERLLSEKGQDEWDKFLRTEERPLVGDEDEGQSCPLRALSSSLSAASHRRRVDRLANIEARVVRLLCSIDVNIFSPSPAPFIIFLV